MKKRFMSLALALILGGSLVACSSKPAEKAKEEVKTTTEEVKKEVEKASAELKEAAIKALEEQRKLELAVPNLSEADKTSVNSKFDLIISEIKEDKVEKKDVESYQKSAETYIKNVKKATTPEEKK